MPYIKDVIRKGDLTPDSAARSAGELTYALTATVQAYLGTFAPLTYEDFASALGALEAAKLELYRKVIVSYEDRKCKENGEVYYINGAK